MTKGHNSLNDYNFDRLKEVLTDQEQLYGLVMQIPDGTHIFHGAQDEPEMTEANLKLAARIHLGMTLGYTSEAPLMMIFKRKDGELVVLDLGEHLQKEEVLAFVEQLAEGGQAKMKAGLQMALAA